MALSGSIKTLRHAFQNKKERLAPLLSSFYRFLRTVAVSIAVAITTITISVAVVAVSMSVSVAVTVLLGRRGPVIGERISVPRDDDAEILLVLAQGSLSELAPVGGGGAIGQNERTIVTAALGFKDQSGRDVGIRFL